jgi:hypothetical protein
MRIGSVGVTFVEVRAGVVGGAEDLEVGKERRAGSGEDTNDGAAGEAGMAGGSGEAGGEPTS